MTGESTIRTLPADVAPYEFEGEESFRLALRVAEAADAVAMRVRHERPWLAAQLGECGLSVLNNTAEGRGEYSPGDKARFYRYARRSAQETAAMVVLLGRKRLITGKEEAALRRLLVQVIQILTRRAIHFQQRSGRPARKGAAYRGR
jgi:four helix bundle protein